MQREARREMTSRTGGREWGRRGREACPQRWGRGSSVWKGGTEPGNADWGRGKGKQVLERGRPNTTDSGI